MNDSQDRRLADPGEGAPIAEAPAGPPPPPAGPVDDMATFAPGSRPRAVEPPSTAPVRLSNLADSEPRDPDARYTRTRFHAKGGVGQVWLARDGKLGREVALKELRLEQGQNEAAWARFVAEARITGQLEHPGIVPVYEMSFQPDTGDPFYTMRFIRGRTLNQAIRAYHNKKQRGQAGPLDLAELLTSFVSLCNTVAYAHSRGVIHRDLKGQNVVLGDFGEVMLLDWGIAKLVGSGEPGAAEAGPAATSAAGEGGPAPDQTLEGQVFGTPFYMAPEQAEGRVSEIDARTDVYGLGAILYEILAGQAPYQGHTTVEVLRKVGQEPPVPPRRIDPAVPRALEAACRKAMSPRPADRYASALDLAEDVRLWLADEPIAAYREPWPVRLARLARRHRTAVAAAAALLMAAGVALAVSTVVVGRERDAALRQKRQARQAVDDNYTRVAEGWLADRLDPLQKEFLEKSVAYYRDFGGADAGDPELRLERGRAHLRLGDVLRKLGRPDEAEPAYRRAVATLGRLAAERPAVPAYRDQLAEANFRLGSERAARGRAADLDEAAQLLDRAAEAQEVVLAEAPTVARRVALGATLDARADLLRVTGRADDAEKMYRRAIAELDRAVAEAPGEVRARHELGTALDGLGYLLKERGRPAEARAPIDRSVQVFEGLVAEAPTLPGPKDQLAKAYNSLGLLQRDLGMAADAEATFDKEISLNRRLAADYPTRPEYRRTLARVLLNQGILFREANRTREADAAYSEALKLCEKLAAESPEVRKYARDQAHCLNNLAELRAARKGESEPLYRKALAIDRALRAAAPGVPEHALDEAGVLLNLANWLVANKRAEESVEPLKQSVDLLEARAAADPDDPTTRRKLARSWNSLGASYFQLKRHAEADDAFARAAAAYDRLVARPPVLPADQLALASCLSNRGNNQTVAALPGAEDSLRRSLAILDAAARGGPASTDLRLRRAAARTNLGEWLAAHGHPEEAEIAYRESVAEFEKLAAESPKVAAYRGLLGQARAGYGEFLIARDRPDDARALLERGIGDERAAQPADPEGREALRKHLGSLAGLVLARGGYAEAADLGDEILKVAAGASAAQPEVARLLARCVPLAAADAKVPPARRAVQAGALADRAIALLREAVKQGGPAAGRLLRDPAFDPIRDRDGFKALEPEAIGRRPTGPPPGPAA